MFLSLPHVVVLLFVLQMPTIHNHMYVDMYWIFFTSLLAAPLPFYTKHEVNENGTRHRTQCTHVSFSSLYFPQLLVQTLFEGGPRSKRASQPLHVSRSTGICCHYGPVLFSNFSLTLLFSHSSFSFWFPSCLAYVCMSVCMCIMYKKKAARVRSSPQPTSRTVGGRDSGDCGGRGLVLLLLQTPTLLSQLFLAGPKLGLVLLQRLLVFQG